MPAKRKKSKSNGFIHTLKRRWWLVAGVVVAALISAAIAGFLSSVPLQEAAAGAQSTKILAVDGQTIGTLHADENRTIVALDLISMHLRDAVIATEDRKFYQHNGVSLRGIMRAAFSNVKGDGVQQGGSTITQQYVRNAFSVVGRDRTILRKIKEATVAVKMERKYSKDKILEFYLNTVYFGRGAYGAEAAARTYFKKSAKDLELSEAAYLAGIIRAPQLYQVERNPGGVTKIRDEVIGDMAAAGKIKAAEAEAARKDDLAARFKFGASAEVDSVRAGYFVEYVRRLLKEEFEIAEKDILGGGLQVNTTLDLRMQDAAEAAVSSTLNKAEDPEAALVAMDPSGNVRAMVGGRDVADPKRSRGSNFAVNIRKDDSSGRQAGSAFKPFTLAAFVDKGKSMKSSFVGPSEIEIASQQCRSEKGEPWKVSNFDNASYGTLDVVEATVKSANTVYAQMADLVTPKKIADLSEAAGVTIPRRERVCALSLGTSPVTPMELARGYTTFAQRGARPDVIVITKIVAPDGKVIAERKPKIEQKMDKEVADSVNHALKENINRGTGTGAKLGRPAAGKTGTTQNHVDAWFAGYTPELTAIVWMGFPPSCPKEKPECKPEEKVIPEMTNVRGKRVTGGSFPATIWKKFMTDALKGVKGTDFVAPAFSGEVVKPSPTPCPSQSPPPTPDPNCIAPSPSPSPSPAAPVPSPSVSAQVSSKPPPKSPSPTPTSPATSISPSP